MLQVIMGKSIVSMFKEIKKLIEVDLIIDDSWDIVEGLKPTQGHQFRFMCHHHVCFDGPIHNYALVAYDPSALGPIGASVDRATKLLPGVLDKLNERTKA